LAKDGKIQDDQSRRLTGSRAGQDAYVGDVDYNALGQTTLLQLGNGLATTYDYYDTNFRLESVVTTGGLQDLSYTYDDVGNVQTMADTVGGLNLTYGYDELDRLTGVSGTYIRTYSYNSIGNLEVKNGLTLYYEDADHPHAVSSTSEDWSLDYSPAGNLITKTVGSQVVTFGYDAENRLTQVVSDTTGSAITTTFVCDGDGRRAKKVDESGKTVYVGEHYEAHYAGWWGANIKLGDGDQPAIAADGAGNVYVIWKRVYYSGTHRANIFLARSADNGESWSEEIRINDSEGDVCSWARKPDIAVDENSNLYVVWTDCRDTNEDIYFRRSTDGGVTWGAASRVNDDPGTSSQSEPAIAMDGVGRVYVVWTDYRNGDRDIYFSRSTDGGQTWSANVRVNDDGGTENQRHPDLAVDEASNAYAVWEDWRDSVTERCDIYFARRDADTGLWGQNVRINKDTNGAYQFHSSIDVDEVSRVHVVWEDWRSQSDEVYSIRSPDGGQNWDAELIVSEYGAKNFLPSVAVEGDGDAYAVWVDDPPDQYNIVSARLNVGGLAWQSRGRVNSQPCDASGSSRPGVAVGGQGNVYAAWASAWGLEVYFSRLSESRITKHYYANGQRVATRVDGALYYIHQDLLGSTVAVSDAAGGEVGRVQYDPYGEVLTSTLPVTLTDRLFTGQRLDSSTGLYYYNARYYDPHLGRFIQPDSLVPDPLNPQAWNRFSYVYNNPTSYVDPSGHFPWLLVAVGVGVFALGGFGGHLAATSAGYEVGSPQWYASVGLGGAFAVGGFALGYFGFGGLALVVGIAGDTFIDTAILGGPVWPSLARNAAFTLPSM
jgi:RHS repeat-associated protein